MDAGGEEGRRFAGGVPQDGVRGADELPAAGGGARVDPRVRAREGDRADRDPGSRGGAAWNVEGLGQARQIAEAGWEPAEGHPELGGRVDTDGLVAGDAPLRGDIGEVRAVVAHRD